VDDITHQTNAANAADGTTNHKALKRILYVEDSKTSQWVMKQKLGKIAEVTIAESLAEGRGMLDTKQFELIIVDWSLPDGKGTDLLPAIRARYSSQQLPVLLVSASLDKVMMMQALQMGVNECHPKPIVWAELIETVERMLSAPYINPLIKAGALVTWVEGHLNEQFWLYCPEADFFIKGSDPDAVRQDASRHLRDLVARSSQPIPTCQVNVSLHLVNFEP
jgi:CheY-like chemotaxis protein